MPTMTDLLQLQSLPLEAKIHLSHNRIREFYNHYCGRVFISFSGGKDSTVMSHLVHEIYPDVPMIFMNTGLEFPEIQAFCRKSGAVIMRPERSFSEVITEYGYPVVSKETAECIYYARRILNGSKEVKLQRVPIVKRKELLGKRIFIKEGAKVSIAKSHYNKAKWLPLAQQTDFMISSRCCYYMKKSDLGKYHRKHDAYPFIGTLAEESMLRKKAWLRAGCNSFDEATGSCRPLSFWLEKDILEYIKMNKLDYCPVYGDIIWNEESSCYECTGHKRTGCIFCLFGIGQTKGDDKFLLLKRTHPRQYEYCLAGGQYIDNPHYDPLAPEMDGEWMNWNPPKIWVPSKEGLGMKYVIDRINQLYGAGFIKY